MSVLNRLLRGKPPFALGLAVVVMLTLLATFPNGTAANVITVRPTITAVTPREVDPVQAPMAVTLSGSGFAAGAYVRLAYPAAPNVAMNLRPLRLTSTQVSVSVGAEWFQMIAQAPVQPPSLRTVASDYFTAMVVNPDGQASNPAGVRLDQFVVRVAGVAPQPLRLIKGQWTAVDVTIERRTSLDAVTLEALGFLPKPAAIPAGAVVPAAGALEPVAGIQGTATVPAGQTEARMYLWSGSNVPDGEYNVAVSVADVGGVVCQNCGGMTIATTAIRPCEPNCPPGTPASFMINSTTNHTISMRWYDQADNESGYHVQRRAPGGMWATVSDVGPQLMPWYAAPPMTYTDTGLIDGKKYCYRVLPWNAYGETPSAEGCATTNRPPLPPGDVQIVPTPPFQYSTYTLSFQDNSDDEDGFHLQWTNNYPSWSTIQSFGAQPGTGTVLQYVDTVPDQYKENCWSAEVFNKWGSTNDGNRCAYPAPPDNNGGNNGGGNQLKADLVAVSMWTDPTWPGAGEAFTAYVQVCNKGATDTGDFASQFSLTTANNNIASNLVVLPLAAWGCTKYWWPLNGLPEGNATVAFCADVNNQVDEVSKANNCISQGLLIGQ